MPIKCLKDLDEILRILACQEVRKDRSTGKFQRRIENLIEYLLFLLKSISVDVRLRSKYVPESRKGYCVSSPMAHACIYGFAPWLGNI